MTAGPPRSREPVKVTRERELNFIYFIDNSKTHTYKIRLSTFRYVAVAAIGFVIAAVVSFYMLYRIEDDRQSTLTYLRKSQTTIFDFQTRHDGVYEVAYPSASRIIAAKVSNASAETSTATPVGKEKSLVPPTEKSASLPKLAVAEKAQSEPESSEIAAGSELKLNFDPVTREASSAITISAESPSVVLDQQAIQFRFDMRNAEAAQRAEGRLFIVAAFEGASGERLFAVEPQSIRVTSDGKVSNPERGVRYSVSNFHHRNFKMAIPSGVKDARLKEISLVFVDKAGSERVEYRTKVNAKLAQSN